jgi:branched-subunit amino acid transport protein
VNGLLVVLAVVMFAATYPTRALPLLAPGFERLPRPVFAYLRLVGPAILAALAAVSVMVVTAGGRPTFHVGVEWLAVLICLGLTVWRRNLLVGLVAAVALTAITRAIGVA